MEGAVRLRMNGRDGRQGSDAGLGGIHVEGDLFGGIEVGPGMGRDAEQSPVRGFALGEIFDERVEEAFPASLRFANLTKGGMDEDDGIARRVHFGKLGHKLLSGKHGNSCHFIGLIRISIEL